MYVGRIFEQVKGRPLFIVDAQTGDSQLPSLVTGELEGAGRLETRQ